MGLLRKTEQLPYQNPVQMSPELAHDPDVAAKILDTYQGLGLDPGHAVLVGSSALYLYGVKLPAYWDDTQRPSDVDLALSTSHFLDIADRWETPGGVRVKHKNIRGLPANMMTTAGVDGVSLPLPVDLINRYDRDRHRSIEAYDRRFHASPFALIEDTGLRIATPGVLLRELHSRASQGDPKAARDHAVTEDILRKRGLDVAQLRKAA